MPGQFALLELKATIPIDIPISSFNVGDEFTLQLGHHLRTRTTAGAEVRRSIAKRRRPARSYATPGDRRRRVGVHGAEADRHGRRDDPRMNPPRLEPAACEPGPGPDPAAGVLQFEAASFTVDEFDGAVPTVAVTRTRRLARARSRATFTTSDGTATAGSDYARAERDGVLRRRRRRRRDRADPGHARPARGARRNREHDAVGAGWLRCPRRAHLGGADDPRQPSRDAERSRAVSIRPSTPTAR